MIEVSGGVLLFLATRLEHSGLERAVVILVDRAQRTLSFQYREGLSCCFSAEALRTIDVQETHLMHI